MNEYSKQLVEKITNTSKTIKNVLEIGSGLKSTPFLRKIAEHKNAFVTSLEDSQEWYNTIQTECPDDNFGKTILCDFVYKNDIFCYDYNLPGTYELVFIDGPSFASIKPHEKKINEILNDSNICLRNNDQVKSRGIQSLHILEYIWNNIQPDTAVVVDGRMSSVLYYNQKYKTKIRIKNYPSPKNINNRHEIIKGNFEGDFYYSHAYEIIKKNYSTNRPLGLNININKNIIPGYKHPVEIQNTNRNDGVGYVARKYLNKWPHDLPLPMVLHHSGGFFRQGAKRFVFDSVLDHVWVIGETQEKSLEKFPGVIPHKLGHPVLYLDKNLSVCPEKKGTLAMPVHNPRKTISDIRDFDEYCKQVVNLPNEFHPISISLPLDMLHFYPICEKYKLSYICAGYRKHLFLENLINMISKFKYVTSNYSNPLFYATYVGAKFFYYGNTAKYYNLNKENPIKKHLWKFEEFSIENVKDEEKYKEVFQEMLGIEHKKDKEDLLKLFHECCQNEKYKMYLKLYLQYAKNDMEYFRKCSNQNALVEKIINSIS